MNRRIGVTATMLLSCLLRMVLADGLRLTLVGLVCGVLGALATTRLLAGLLFGVGASDPVTFGGLVAVLTRVALAACWIPARRAAKVSPLVALRSE